MSAFETNRRNVIALATGATLLPMIAVPGAEAATRPAIGLGRDQDFDSDWRFHRGAADGAEAAALDDAGWRKVDLPHDWAIEDIPGGKAPRQIGPFDRDAMGGVATGYTQGGEGWYRKHFRLGVLPAEARVEIDFDGIYNLSDVWLNGKPLGAHVHGYTPFGYDLTPHIVRDGDNVLAVRVRNFGRNSRWYAGSGIYRSVRLNVSPTATRVARWGVAASTRRIGGSSATIDVATTIENPTTGLTLTTRLRDARGRIAALARGAADAAKQVLAVAAPKLWTPTTPTLYTLETELARGSVVLDRVTQPFGIRIVTMDTTKGLQVNGTHTVLRGGCIHHDNGLLGAVAYPEADLRRVRLLKVRGYNAIRSSHNPASASLRQACDTLGMLLIEESFDMWHVAKNKDDYSNHFRQDWQNALREMVLSARNSPSVIMWSIGNEVPDRSTPEGVEWCWKLANEVRRLDPTRPVTAALNGVLGAPVVASERSARPGKAGKPDNASTVFLDVAGYNYKIEDIAADHAAHPDRVIYASETFPIDSWDYQRLVEQAPYFLGEFVWTAMDYIGEAGIGATARVKANVPYYFPQWPWVNAWCGDIDLVGHQKPQSLVRDVVWGLRPLALLVQRPIEAGKRELIAPWGWRDELPSWTWGDAAGTPMAVRVYTAGDRVELLLNGKSVGARTLTVADKGFAEFSVPYAAGALEGIAYRGGKVLGRQRIETIGAPATLRVAPERATAKTGRHGLSYVGIELLDARGRVVPEGEVPVTLTVSGPAELIALGAANPYAGGSLQSPSAKTFRGRALAILRSTGPGTVRIEARSDALAGGAATIRIA